LNKALAILVFLSLFAQGIVQLGIIGYYQINKDYIAKNLCENRDKPKMKCCGKCYLRKQLKKAEGSNSSKDAPGKIEKAEQLVFIISATEPVSSCLQHLTLSVRNPTNKHLHNYDFLSRVFHPPSFIS